MKQKRTHRKKRTKKKAQDVVPGDLLLVDAQQNEYNIVAKVHTHQDTGLIDIAFGGISPHPPFRFLDPGQELIFQTV